MSTLYLIRHGKTAANESHRYCGSTDLSLSDSGMLALKQLRYDLHAERYLTSGMKRTNETFAILFGEIPYEEMHAFREIDFGDFEMHTYEELKDNPDYLTWISGDNESNVPPNGESGVQMLRRVLQALPELFETDTVLVTHGGVIAGIMDNLFPNEGKNRYQWQPEPGHGYAVSGNQYWKIP